MTQTKPPDLNAYLRVKEDTGFVFAVVVSLILHGALIGLAVWKSQKPKRHPLPTAITVSLTSNLPTSRGGRQTKAPVARPRQTKAVAPKKKETKKTQKKSSNKENKVGLKSRDTTPRKPRPKPETDQPKAEPAQTSRSQRASGAGGAEESGVSFDIGSRGTQDLDLNQARFQDYYRRILNEVDRRWAKGNLSGGTSTVTFKVAKDGAISNVEVSVSSGFSYLDGPAKRAILGARLPPLPQGFDEDELIVTINFRYGSQ